VLKLCFPPLNSIALLAASKLLQVLVGEKQPEVLPSMLLRPTALTSRPGQGVTGGRLKDGPLALERGGWVRPLSILLSFPLNLLLEPVDQRPHQLAVHFLRLDYSQDVHDFGGLQCSVGIGQNGVGVISKSDLSCVPFAEGLNFGVRLLSVSWKRLSVVARSRDLVIDNWEQKF
jgi:hypothetical protein